MIRANMYFYVHDGPKTPLFKRGHIFAHKCTYTHVEARIYVQIRAIRAKI